jgi:hypothetical protein
MVYRIGAPARGLPELSEEELKEIEARHSSIFGPDAVAAQRAMEELAETDVPELVAEVRRLRVLVASR